LLDSSLKSLTGGGVAEFNFESLVVLVTSTKGDFGITVSTLIFLDFPACDRIWS
jgi:hypothetical protein